MELRPYQIDLVDRIKAAWDNGANNVLAQLSTGGGKTVLFASIVAACRDPAIVIAHRVEIVSQISLTLARHKIRHNIIGQKAAIREIVALHMYELKQSFYDPQSQYVVAGVDTLIRMNPQTKWFKQIKLVVQDEAHHVLKHNKWGTAAALFPNALGLYPTATPIRADGNGLGRHADGLIDVMVCGPTMRELINMNYLSEYRIISPPNDLDLRSVPISAGGDYSPPKLRDAVHRSHITGDVVEHYIKFAEGKLGVTFAVDIKAATEISLEFKRRGIPAELITSKTPDLLRASIMRRFRNREILQLVNVDLLGEGVDVPAIEVISMARPTQSYGLYSQQFGRALRPMPGKTRAIIIDHVSNVMHHGLPDSLRRVWSLDRRERKRSQAVDVIPVRVCLNSQCLAVYERIYRECPACGHYTPPIERESPAQVDGDLLELSPEILAAMRGEIDKTVGYHPDPLIQHVLNKNYKLRMDAQISLRESIAQWAGYHRAYGCTDSEIYRRFYFNFGLDIMSAQSLKPKDANELDIKINKIIDEFVKGG